MLYFPSGYETWYHVMTSTGVHCNDTEIWLTRNGRIVAAEDATAAHLTHALRVLTLAAHTHYAKSSDTVDRVIAVLDPSGELAARTRWSGFGVLADEAAHRGIQWCS